MIELVALLATFYAGWWCGKRFETPKALWEALKAHFKG